MTKRFFSIFVAMTMLISCFAFVASAEEDARYEGIKYFQSAEDMLTALNEDSGSSNSAMWDYADRKGQQAIITAAANAFSADFTGEGLVNKWKAYCDRVLTRDEDGIGSRDGNVINYLKMLDIFKTEDASLKLKDEQLLVVKEAFESKHLADEYKVAKLSLKESLDKLDGYTNEMGAIISKHRETLNAYNLTDEKKTEYMLHGTKALYQIAFQKTGTAMREAFDTGFLGDDEGKKLIAVMYGKALTSELATDNLSTVLISYVNKNFADVKNSFGDLVKEEYGEETEKALFAFLKNTVSEAYNASSATEEVKADIKMLFGDSSVTDDKGALQLMFETLDSSKADSYGMLNIWFNLFLRQHTQLSVGGVEATTLEAGVVADDNRIVIKNNSSALLKVKELDRYGISADNGLLSLGSDWLDLKVYNADRTENTFVTYSKEDGKFYVSLDSGKDATYPGYIQLVRNDGTYIETYPVTIKNTKSSVLPPSSSNKYTVTYETNGGTKISSEKYSEGSQVKLTKVPVKEGYVFEGWYTDAELTDNITEFIIKESITVYAKWVEDNGTAGGSYPTPDALNGEEHFAYVIGYPDGTVRPENNITRAEVAAIFFRLLKDDVREANLSDENQFTDVNEGEWYNTAISTLVKLGIVNGRTATEFVPNEPITRAEFATICARFDDSDYMITDSFTDISTHWAVSYIREAAARGWIKGYEDSTFRPDRLITRAETMTLINRILNRAPETQEDLLDDMIKWVDNPETAWYYLPVQEATNSHTYDKKNNVYEKWSSIEEGTDWTQYQN